jgi:myo-inositol-hexaphosphate 3-phosphohydrolase
MPKQRANWPISAVLVSLTIAKESRSTRGRTALVYIVCTDQIAGNSEYHVYRREGEPGSPHDHSKLLKVLRGGADSTDGLKITSMPLGPKFPAGIMVAMNSRERNFLLYRWEDVADKGEARLVAGR